MKYLIFTFLLLGIKLFGQSTLKPQESQFTKVILDEDLNEPMELAIAKDGIIYYIERCGHLNSYNPNTNKKKRITTLKVRYLAEDGLMGLALDPNFINNNFIYLYYGNPTLHNKEYTNVLARFTLTSAGLSNKIEMLHIPLIHEGVSHSAGSLAFDKNGNLYLSTGDNTNPFDSGGYAPTDDREGNVKFDALKSSANTNDLRGKILRIHPEEDGTYTIPEGNLFPKGMPGTLPEIYIMGCRNPFRISLDNKNDFLYWGDVGPDAGKDSLTRGPKGHDEINQARKAGNFGWPLFVADNKPYYIFDFEKKQSHELYNAQKPINLSRNNTGIKNLPIAQKAFIWYPYNISSEFSELGTGGRNAMAGPVYYFDDYGTIEGKFPAYFDKKLFIYDWMRGWVFTTIIKPNGDFENLERFMTNEEFNHPMDMAFNSNGVLYMLEYGTYWRAKNKDAKLVRIEYNEGNRKPIAKISANKTVGGIPLKVNFSAKGSFDYDKNDSLKFEWFFTQNKRVEGHGMNPIFTFNRKGIYTCKVRVIDSKGKFNENFITIKAGNEPPTVNINWQGNRSFYFGNTKVKYQINVKDKEDKIINSKRIKVNFQYLPEGEDIVGLILTGENSSFGKKLISQSDCNACHGLKNKSIGPSYIDISKKYTAKDTEKLIQKVIEGGGGVWTKEHAMAAHPQLLKEDVQEMINYILSLSKANPKIKTKGTVNLNKSNGNYILVAQYIDSGGLIAKDILNLRPSILMASEADLYYDVAKKNSPNGSFMSFTNNKAWVCFKNIDLNGLKTVTANILKTDLKGDFEMRLDNPNGKLIASIPINGIDTKLPSTKILETKEMSNIYLVFNSLKSNINIWNSINLNWVEFKP